MKKRLTAMLLSALMVISFASMPVFAYAQTSSVNSVKDATEDYLYAQMSRVYHWEESDNAIPETILTVEQPQIGTQSASASVALSESAKKFIESESADVMESLGRSSVTAVNMAEDLQTMENYILYRSHIFEDMDITFTSFDVDYYFDDVAVDGDYAVAKVYESLVYQYTDSPDKSSELNYYYIVLKKRNEAWYDADVVSDDVPYLTFLDGGLTATEAIAGYDAAIEIENTAADLPITPAVASNDIGYGVNNWSHYLFSEKGFLLTALHCFHTPH